MGLLSISLVVDIDRATRYTLSIPVHVYLAVRVTYTPNSRVIVCCTIATFDIRAVLMDRTMSLFRPCVVPRLHILSITYKHTRIVGVCTCGYSVRDGSDVVTDTDRFCRF